eukprot:gene20019-22753_t
MSVWLCLATYILVLLALVQARLMFDELGMSTLHAQHYSKLMDNQHIVMIGDSLMRYQYLSLVYLINTNTFYPANKKPGILWEGDHKSWNLFYNATNFALYPNEYCDCYRVGFINENRYYFNKERNITISYVAYFGDGADQKIHGHWSPLDNETNHQFHGPTLGDFIPYRWETSSIQEALSTHAAKLKPKPSVLVLNAGFWLNKYNQTDHRKSVFKIATSLFDWVIWKTTNYDREHMEISSYGICQFPGVECLNLDWTQYLQPEEYKDLRHLQPDIYTDINIQFILQLTHGHSSVAFVPLSANYYDNIVHFNEKSYLVNPEGLLRPLTVPHKRDAKLKKCWMRLQNRTHVHLPASKLKKHILGPRVTNVCAPLETPQSKHPERARHWWPWSL